MARLPSIELVSFHHMNNREVERRLIMFFNKVESLFNSICKDDILY